MKEKWLADAEWARIQQVIPIACVEVFVLSDDATPRVGLIHRDTSNGPGWCLVGGRLLHEESLAEGVSRQLIETLGNAIRFEVEKEPHPIYMAQYFPTRTDLGMTDPRQHALTSVFAVKVEGTVRAQGEAHSFEWFEATKLPKPAEFGFGHDRVAAACLKALAKQVATR